MTRAVRAAALLSFLAIAAIAIPTPGLAQDFVRGDCNDDGGTDIADPVALLAFLFGGGGTPLVCESACDGNDDGAINIADAVSMLAALFGSPTVPLPGPSTCGSDPTPDALTCANYTNCASAAVPLAAVRAAADGPIDLLVADLLVTTFRPDSAGTPGFCVQESPTGPALRVSVDPAALVPPVVPGDVIDIRFTEVETLGSGGKTATAVTDVTILSSGNDVTPFLQDVSDATDLVTAQTDYASEIVTVVLTPQEGILPTAGVFSAASCSTAGDATGNLAFAAPTSVVTALGLLPFEPIRVRAVVVDAPIPPATALLADSADDIEFLPPTVVDAGTAGTDQVAISFSTPIDPASVTDPATQFTLDPPVAVLGASVAGSGVTLTTGPLTLFETYTVTVASSVTAIYGGLGVDPAANSADFVVLPDTPSTLVVNEIDYDQPGIDTMEYIEIYNPTPDPQALVGVALVLVNGANEETYLCVDLGAAGTVLPPGGFLVVKSPNVTADPSALTIDFASTENNIQNGGMDAVVLLDDMGGDVIDMVSYEGPCFGDATCGLGFFSGFLYEGTTTSAIDTNISDQVIQRFPDGTDTDDNSFDWVESFILTPGAPNQP